MKTFRDLESFQHVLGSAYKQEPVLPGATPSPRLLKVSVIKKEQATQYASVVLSMNDEGSARRAAQKRNRTAWLVGARYDARWWHRLAQDHAGDLGISGQLTYYYKRQSYEGGIAYTNFAGKLSKPSSSVEFGVWGSGDCSRGMSGTLSDDDF